MTRILAADSVTELGTEVQGAVLIAGSHGGVIAAYLAALAGTRAVILNDAGGGKDGAGVAGLAYLDGIGMAAATVSHLSARIGDGADALARGVVSRANRAAAACGVIPGLPCRIAAERLREAPEPFVPPPPYEEGRYLLDAVGTIEIRGLDSVGKAVPGDAGHVLVIGSHGALHGGRLESALGVAARAAVFHDAGIGVDDAGLSRLPALDARGIPAATVACASARIGDARSMWATGRLSVLNSAAARLGGVVDMSASAFARLAAGAGSR